MMTLKIERVKSKVKTVSLQRNTAVFHAVLQNILTLFSLYLSNFSIDFHFTCIDQCQLKILALNTLLVNILLHKYQWNRF